MKKVLTLAMLVVVMALVIPSVANAQLWFSEKFEIPDFSSDTTATESYYIRLPKGVSTTDSSLQMLCNWASADSVPHLTLAYKFAYDKRANGNVRPTATNFIGMTSGALITDDSLETVHAYMLIPVADDTVANGGTGTFVRPNGLIVTITGYDINSDDTDGDFIITGVQNDAILRKKD